MDKTFLELYQKKYQLDHTIIKQGKESIALDQHKHATFDREKPIYIFDLDHTLLNTTTLKETLRHALTSYDVTPERWDATYKEAKTAQNFYDFEGHLDILATFISSLGKTVSTVQLQERLFAATSKQADSFIYPAIATYFEQHTPANWMILTSGSVTTQRHKITGILALLHQQPQLIAITANTFKGQVIRELYPILQQHITLPHLVIVEDNLSELQDIQQQNPNLPLTLVRLKQPHGLYNSNKNTSSTIFDIDLEAYPNHDLYQELQKILWKLLSLPPVTDRVLPR